MCFFLQKQTFDFSLQPAKVDRLGVVIVATHFECSCSVGCQCMRREGDDRVYVGWLLRI